MQIVSKENDLHCLTFRTLYPNSVDNKFVIFSYFSLKHDSYGDNLHAMSTPIFWEK